MLTATLVSLRFRYLAVCGVVDVARPILNGLAQKIGAFVR